MERLKFPQPFGDRREIERLRAQSPMLNIMLDPNYRPDQFRVRNSDNSGGQIFLDEFRRVFNWSRGELENNHPGIVMKVARKAIIMKEEGFLMTGGESLWDIASTALFFVLVGYQIYDADKIRKIEDVLLLRSCFFNDPGRFNINNPGLREGVEELFTMGIQARNEEIPALFREQTYTRIGRLDIPPAFDECDSFLTDF